MAGHTLSIDANHRFALSLFHLLALAAILTGLFATGKSRNGLALASSGEARIGPLYTYGCSKVKGEPCWGQGETAATYHNALLITHAIAIGFCAISLYMTLVTSRSIRFNAKARFMGLFTFAACLAMIGVILYLLGTVGFDRLSAGIAFSSAATGIELIAFATLMVIWAKYSHRDESGQPITKLSTAEQARRRKENAFWKDKVAQLPVPSPPPVPANSSSKRPSQKDRPPSFASVDAEQEFGANSKRMTLGQVMSRPVPRRRWSRFTRSHRTKPAPLAPSRPPAGSNLRPAPPTPALMSPPTQPQPMMHSYDSDVGLTPPTLVSMRTRPTRRTETKGSKPSLATRRTETVASRPLTRRTDQPTMVSERPSRQPSIATERIRPTMSTKGTEAQPSMASRPATQRSQATRQPTVASERARPQRNATTASSQPSTVREPTLQNHYTAPAPPKPATLRPAPAQPIPPPRPPAPSKPAKPPGPTFGERAGAFAGALGRFGKNVVNKANAAMSSSPSRAPARQPPPSRPLHPQSSPLSRFLPFRRGPEPSPLPQHTLPPRTPASPFARFLPRHRHETRDAPATSRRWLPASPRLDFWRRGEKQPDIERQQPYPAPSQHRRQPSDDYETDEEEPWSDEEDEEPREILRDSHFVETPRRTSFTRATPSRTMRMGSQSLGTRRTGDSRW